MDRADIAGILEENLAEEKAADRKLTAIAEARVNIVAESRKAVASRRARGSMRQRIGGDRRASSRK
jgi:hypothetical protein